MPGAALIATQLTDHSAWPFTLTQGNIDVSRYTPFDSISVTEDGPGAVSQCSYTVVDPLALVGAPVPGSEVWMWDNGTGTPIFGGILIEWSVEAMAGSTGRVYSVTAFGLEVLLDWGFLPAQQFGAQLNSPSLSVKVKQCLDAFPAFGLRTFVGTANNGDLDHPIGDLGLGSMDDFSGVTTSAGSLREVIGQALNTFLPVNQTYVDAVLTIDFYRGARFYYRDQKPDDYTDLTIVDTIAGTLASTHLEYEVHPGDVVRSVFVNGLNPAGTGTVTDGSGIFGKSAYLDEPLSDSAAVLAYVGAAVLATQAPLVRGTVSIENYTPSVGTIHPGSDVIITDANVGLSAQEYPIATISKTFNKNGTQNWTVAFGGRRPSAMTQLRRDNPNTGRATALGTFEPGSGIRR